ncbi:MAG: hypothetical protein NT051_05555 [Candidatus Micrarchaeota archaeon]|nr:hypothetical protein [Candidatus Micrarchaeota archaeon]
MLRFRDTIILFADERLYEAYKDKVELARPVNTAMKAIALEVPLGDVLAKDGKQTYVPIKEGGITELIQVDDRLLTHDNLNKNRQLIKAESNWQTSGKGSEFVTRMLEGNDQMSMNAPKNGWNNLSRIPDFLFSEKELREGNRVQEFLKEYGSVSICLAYPDNEGVAGGLVSAGDAILGNVVLGGRWGAVVPDKLSFHPWVFIYSAAEGAKTGAQATEEAPKKLIVATPEMVNKVKALQEKFALFMNMGKWTEPIGAAIAELKQDIDNLLQ